MTDYIVLRPAPDAPEDFLPAHLDGRWIDTRTSSPQNQLRALGFVHGRAESTGRTEQRPDGAVAEVWELHPFEG